MSIKMVVTDLDGTLLDHNDQISEANIRAFQQVQDKGILTVVATGRMACESEYAIKAIGAFPYFIGVNGGRVENMQTQEVLYEHPLDSNTAIKLCELLESQQIFFQIYMDAGVMCTPRTFEQLEESGISKGYIKKFKKTILVRSLAELYGRKIYKILLITGNKAAVEMIQKELKLLKLPVDFVTSLQNYYEIVPYQLDKSVGLKVLCDHLHITKDEVLAIGDSENDIGMLKAAGIGIALDNSRQKVKEIADYVSKSNEMDGVKHALCKFILN